MFACSKEDPAAPLTQADATVDTDAGATAGPNVVTTTGLPCAVSQVLSTNCQTCHGATPQAGASTSLVTWNDLQKDVGGKKLYEVVKERVHAETQRMPPAGTLSDAQLESIDDWSPQGHRNQTRRATSAKDLRQRHVRSIAPPRRS